MIRGNTLLMMVLGVSMITGLHPSTVLAALPTPDPDAVGTVTLAQPAVKANPDDNRITASGTNAVTAAAAANGWVIPAAMTDITVFGVGQTTGYTVLFTVTVGAGGNWTADSIVAANETYDVWATAVFRNGAMPPDTQTVGSEMKGVVVNKANNPITWVVGVTATYSPLYPKRTGAGAFITGQGTYTLNQGFKFDTAPFAFTTIPKDGGVVRGTGVAAASNVWSTIALPVPASLKYNTYLTCPIDLGTAPPPGANQHIINVIAKNR